MNWIGGGKGGERRKERNPSNKPSALDCFFGFFFLVFFFFGHWETFLIGAKTIDAHPAGEDELYGLFRGVFYYRRGAQEVFGARPAPRPALIELATVTQSHRARPRSLIGSGVGLLFA